MKTNKIVGIVFLLVALLFLYMDYKNHLVSTNFIMFLMFITVSLVLFNRKK